MSSLEDLKHKENWRKMAGWWWGAPMADFDYNCLGVAKMHGILMDHVHTEEGS